MPPLLYMPLLHLTDIDILFCLFAGKNPPMKPDSFSFSITYNIFTIFYSPCMFDEKQSMKSDSSIYMYSNLIKTPSQSLRIPHET